MIRVLAQSTRIFFRAHKKLSLAMLCLWAVAFSGCAWRPSRAKHFPWNSSAQNQPKVPEVGASPEGDGNDELAQLQPELQPPPSTLVAAYSVPARPRVPVSSPTPSEAAAKPEPLTIAPQLTPQEAEAAQQQTNLSLSIAERNMLATQGKSLNAGQSDLASKVRSFIAEAREAAHNSDWTRARNAAKKAEVLSEQLASSFR
jgi:hypothetical protein